MVVLISSTLADEPLDPKRAILVGWLVCSFFACFYIAQRCRVVCMYVWSDDDVLFRRKGPSVAGTPPAPHYLLSHLESTSSEHVLDFGRFMRANTGVNCSVGSFYLLNLRVCVLFWFVVSGMTGVLWPGIKYRVHSTPRVYILRGIDFSDSAQRKKPNSRRFTEHPWLIWSPWEFPYRPRALL